MGPGDKSEKAVAVETLATDGSNWPLWRATMLSFFESKNLLRHIEGTAVKPPGPVVHPKGTALTEEQEILQNRAEERLEKYLAREGLVKTQVIISVSEALFKSFLLGSQDLKVNLCGLQQDIHSDSVK